MSLMIPSSFDEREDDTTLRTLIDFTLTDSDGNMIPLSALGDGQAHAEATGYVMEPLPVAWREKLLEILSSCSTADCERLGISLTTTVSNPPLPLSPVDWDSINVGSVLDGYCTKTLKWYEAKVVEVAKVVSNDKPEGEGSSYKVHFKGWNSKHDEWIERGSDRLSAHHSMTQAADMQDVVQRVIVPWYENTDLYQQVQRMLGPLPHRDVIPITIPDVEDWCIDYSYANPTLWLISSAGVWYRVCGPLVPKGCQPSPEYSSILEPYLEKYAAAAHVAFCLMDFYPTNRKLSLSDVVDEITIRSGGRIDECVVLSHFDFIAEQLTELSHPNDVDGTLNFSKSVFMSQLLKKGKSTLRSRKKKGRLSERKLIGLPKSVVDKSHGGVYDLEFDTPKQISNREKVSRTSTDPYGTTRVKGKPVVMNDADLWAIQAQHGVTPPPLPSPLHTDDTDRLFSVDQRQTFIPSVLRVWSCLMNFRAYLDIPFVSLDDMVALLRGEFRATDPLWSDPSSAHALLREIHIALLRQIVSDRNSASSYTKVERSQCLLRNTKSKHLSSDYMDALSLPMPVKNAVCLWKAMGCDTPPVDGSKVSSILRICETWVEASRLIITEAMEESPPSPEYSDVVADVEAILESLLTNPISKYFTHVSNVEVDNENGGRLEAVHVTGRCPHDLTCVLDKIKRGVYEFGAYNESHDDSSVGILNPAISNGEKTVTLKVFDMPIRKGLYVDAYSPYIHAWNEGVVVDIIPTPSGEDRGNSFVVSFERWGDAFNETYDGDTLLVAPARTFTKNIDLRHLKPDTISEAALRKIVMNYKENQLKTTPRDRSYTPHEAIKRDVESIFNAAMNQYSENTDTYNAAVALKNEFQRQYELEVRTKLTALDDSHDPKLRRDEESLVCSLRDGSYLTLSLERKVYLLQLLCTEMLGTSTCRSYIDQVADLKMRAEKNKASERKSRCGADVEGKVPRPMSRGSRGVKRSLDGANKDDDTDAGENDGNVISVDNCTKIPESIDSSASVAACEESREQKYDHSQVELRFSPVGCDRDGREYWIFPHDTHPHRLFVMNTISPECIVYSTVEDIQRVIDWLSIWGVKESMLKKFLTTWLEDKMHKPQKVEVTEEDNDRTCETVACPAGNDALVGTVLDNRENADSNQVAQPAVVTTNDMPGHCSLFPVHVTLTAKGQMEAGVKDLDGRVVLTTFKYNSNNTSCAKECGLRIGDQIVAVNGTAVCEIASLQRCIKRAVSNARDKMATTSDSNCESGSSEKAMERPKLFVLVLRHPDPLSLPAFKLAHNVDSELRDALHSQVNDDKARLSNSKEDSIYRSVTKCDNYAPKRFCGLFLQMLFDIRNCYSTNPRWMGNDMRALLETVAGLFGSKIAVDTETVVVSLRRCLLEMENVLFISGRTLRKFWLEGRYRYKWRVSCMRARGYGMLSVSLAILHAAVDWAVIEDATLPMDRTAWMQLCHRAHRINAPTPMDTVVFYPEGLRIATKAIVNNGHIELPGISCTTKLDDFGDSGFLCQVLTVRLYSGGPRMNPSDCCPYFRLDLKVMPTYAGVAYRPVLLPYNEPSMALHVKQTRLYNRILNVLHAMPEALPFVNPVSRQDYPDYYTVVRHPMDLTSISLKVKHGSYHSTEEFRSDVERILVNCKMYCTDRFPDMIPLAEEVYDVTVGLLNKLKSELAGNINGDGTDEEPVVDVSSERHSLDSRRSPVREALPTPEQDVSAVRGTTPPSCSRNLLSTSRPQATTHPLPIPSTRSMAPQPLSNSVLTVCIPANKRLCENECIVDLVAYNKSLGRFRYACEDRVVLKKYGAIKENQNNPSVESQYGAIVGCKNSTDTIIPYKWLNVEWDLLDDIFSSVNPWEVSLVNSSKGKKDLVQ